MVIGSLGPCASAQGLSGLTKMGRSSLTFLRVEFIPRPWKMAHFPWLGENHVWKEFDFRAPEFHTVRIFLWFVPSTFPYEEFCGQVKCTLNSQMTEPNHASAQPDQA